MTKSRDYDAVIWDMDGLIFDTERLSFLAWQAGAKAIGLEIDLLLFQSLIGMNAQAIQQKLRAEFGEDTDVVALTKAAGASYDQLIAQGAPLKQGAKTCLETIAASPVPQALATSSSQRYASQKLAHHDLLKLFDATVTGDQVSQGKPHPEPYLLAAQKLGISPDRCIAFEDSVNGIHAAKTAGMTTVLIPDMCPHDAESLAKVDWQFPTLNEALPFLREQFGLDAQA
ncbi:HAD family phosphatase [Pelagicoccus sp. SDUM812005]|uniref:HAD family hydrolase n=1 Tax=Pelagicoccus sp. SDUM812005 TaxID=3041257 RepID=UPI00280C5059|nr:HAD family phosphatase [Pelagicoccus sp. SDUM812005]MDQ8182477.1 HAD family phosphatase [Pelagicoccus sp. SDUM812005]